MRDITLAALISELKEKMEELKALVEKTPNSIILANFYDERIEDYNLFMKYSSKLSYNLPLYLVSSELRGMGAPRRLFGGICSKGAEYFNLTHEVEKEILNYMNSPEGRVKKEAEETEIDLSMNPDFVDLADLSRRQFTIFNERYCEQHHQNQEEEETPKPEDECKGQISIFDK